MIDAQMRYYAGILIIINGNNNVETMSENISKIVLVFKDKH